VAGVDPLLLNFLLPTMRRVGVKCFFVQEVREPLNGEVGLVDSYDWPESLQGTEPQFFDDSNTKSGCISCFSSLFFFSSS
jgi:hypothetical protein